MPIMIICHWNFEEGNGCHLTWVLGYCALLMIINYVNTLHHVKMWVFGDGDMFKPMWYQSIYGDVAYCQVIVKGCLWLNA